MDSLPNGVLGQILSYLSLWDFTVCTRVSHRFHQCCKLHPMAIFMAQLEFYWEHSINTGAFYLAFQLNDYKVFCQFHRCSWCPIPKDLCEAIVIREDMKFFKKLYSKNRGYKIIDQTAFIYYAALHRRIRILKFLERRGFKSKEDGWKGALDGAHEDLFNYYQHHSHERLQDHFPEEN
jgi:hypothetical protein